MFVGNGDATPRPFNPPPPKTKRACVCGYHMRATDCSVCVFCHSHHEPKVTIGWPEDRSDAKSASMSTPQGLATQGSWAPSWESVAGRGSGLDAGPGRPATGTAILRHRAAPVEPPAHVRTQRDRMSVALGRGKARGPSAEPLFPTPAPAQHARVGSSGKSVPDTPRAAPPSLSERCRLCGGPAGPIEAPWTLHPPRARACYSAAIV